MTPIVYKNALQSSRAWHSGGLGGGWGGRTSEGLEALFRRGVRDANDLQRHGTNVRRCRGQGLVDLRCRARFKVLQGEGIVKSGCDEGREVRGEGCWRWATHNEQCFSNAPAAPPLDFSLVMFMHWVGTDDGCEKKSNITRVRIST